MKRLGIVLIFGLMGPGFAVAQASISVGAAFPLAPEGIRDAYSSGFGLWGAFGISRRLVFTPRVVAGFDVFRTDEDFLRDISEELGADVEGGDLSTIFAGVDALFVVPPGRIRPYVAPGVGFAIVSVADFTVRDVAVANLESEQAVALTLTAGAAIRLGGGPHLLIEARLVRALTEGDRITWMPIHVGILFDLD